MNLQNAIEQKDIFIQLPMYRKNGLICVFKDFYKKIIYTSDFNVQCGS